jgi:CubicO group peptidase (beta-lactamase class C family)
MMRLSTMRLSTMRLSMMRLSTMRLSTMRLSTMRLSRVSVMKWLSLVGISLVFMLSAISISAQEAPTYTPPDESYTIPVPASLTDESTEEYAQFTAEDSSTIYIVRVEAENAPDELAATVVAVTVVDPEQTLEPQEINDAITPKGIWKQYVYVSPDGSGPISVAIVRKEGEAFYVMYVVSPDQQALVAVTPALNEMLIGIEFASAANLTNIDPVAFDDVMAADLDTYIEQALVDFQIPGASVAVVQGGEVVYRSGFGVRELDGEAVDADTLFMIGSTTKSMTTFLLATLVDEGALTWDTPVTDILPEFALSDAAATEQIRVRDLVNNSSGVPRYDLVLILKYLTPEEMIASLATIPLVAAPGEMFNYSNQMVATGGFVAALAAGATLGEDVMQVYTDLLQTRLFDPLGMERSTLSLDKAVADPNHAFPYSLDIETEELEPVSLDLERFVEPLAPAGAVWSSANEMAKYLQFELAFGETPEGERLVSTENLVETQSPGLAMGDGSRYAMGWYVANYSGLPLIMHGGNTSGFTSEFAFIPEGDLGVVVLANRATANNFTAAVRDYVFEIFYGLDHESEAVYAAAEAQIRALYEQLLAATAQGQPVDPATVEPFVGEYDLSFTLTLNEDNQLIATSDFIEGEILATETEGEYVGGEGDWEGLMFTFATAEDGTPTVTLTNPIDPSVPVTLNKLQ